MEEKVRRGRLYDFYGALLSERQREIFEYSVYDDLSLTEIAGLIGITKQGVSDQLKRCTSTMEDMDARLGLCDRFDRIEERLEEIIRIADERKLLDIRRLADEIADEL